MAILEFQRFDNYVRVAAVDENSGVEAVSIFPATLSRSEMEDQAVKKLKYVLNKKKRDKDSEGGYV